MGATPTTYGPGLVERIRALAPAGVDAVIDCAGGPLPDLVTIVGNPAHVVTIADFTAAAHGVHMSYGAPADDAGTAIGAADPLAVHGLEPRDRGHARKRGQAAGAGHRGISVRRGRCRPRIK